MDMTNHSAPSKGSALFWRTTAAAALIFCLTPGTYAQQDQQGQQQDQQSQGQQQDQQQGQQGDQQQQTDQPWQQQSQDAPARPTYAPQDADRPPYSHDRSLPYGSDGRYRNPNQNTQAAQPAQPLPGILTIPAGTVLVVRTNDFLSTDRNHIGDTFTATLDQPLVVNGWVVARRGQTIVGKVKDVRKAGRVKGTSELGVELTDITIVDGRQLPILTELWKGSGGTSHGQDAATIVGTTGLGAAIGAAADWGRGAAIGAGAGAVAGIGAVLLTRGRPTVVAPETQLSFRLVDPVSVDTTQSAQAFQPVSEQDYGRHFGPRYAGGYPPPGPGPYPYPYPYYGPYYPYPYPYVGFYYGWGRGYYGRRYWR
jgi:hypothetical protein